MNKTYAPHVEFSDEKVFRWKHSTTSSKEADLVKRDMKPDVIVDDANNRKPNTMVSIAIVHGIMSRCAWLKISHDHAWRVTYTSTE